MNDELLPAHFSAAGELPAIELLAGFVPMNDLSTAHLATIARMASVMVVPEGQFIADQNILDDCYVYLVSGAISTTFCVTGQQVEYTAASFGMLSVGDYLESVRTITAATDTRVLIVNRHELDSMLCWDQVAKSLKLELCAEREYDEDRGWINTLLTSNLFHKIPPYNIRTVLDKFSPRVVQNGEVIVRQGARGDDCYIIKEGRAQVTQQVSETAEPSVVAELHAGQCFGEDALVNDSLRNASVTMESNGVLMVLNKRDFMALQTEPAIEGISIGEADSEVAAGATWLDVRSQQEYDHDHRRDAFHLPLHLMSVKARLMEPNYKYMAYCSTGRRAATAARLLQQRGFDVTPVMRSP